MAIHPKGLPYQQGMGEAYIFPKADLSGMRRLTDQMERRGNALLEDQRKEQEHRQRQIRDIMDKNYDLGQQRDIAVIGAETQKMRDYVTEQLGSGNRNVLRAGTPEWSEYKKMEDNIINAAKNSTAEYQNVAKAIQQIKSSSDPYLDKEKAIAQVLDYYYGQDGKKTIFSENYGTMPNWMDGAFHSGRWVEDFVKDLPEVVSSTISNTPTADGNYIDTTEATGKFFEQNSDGSIALKDGKPIIKVNENTVALALQDERWKRYIEDELKREENKGLTPEQLTIQKLSPHSYMNITRERKKGFSKDQPHKGGAASRKKEVYARQEFIERTQKNIESQPNSLKGGTLPDGKTRITQVEYDAPNSKLWFNNRSESVDISAENNGGFSELWNIYNTVPGFKKIDITELKENSRYKEKYTAEKDNIDYSENSRLDKDTNELIDSAADDEKRDYITTLLKENDEVKSVEWEEGAIKITYYNQPGEKLKIPSKREELDVRTYKTLQSLLIRTNKKRYELKKSEENAIDFGSLNY